MSITDELREWVTDHYSGWKSKQAEGIAIADRIDAEHERQLGVLYRDMSDAEWIRLPVDADGVPIHVGDVMEWPDGETFDVIGIGDGVLFYTESECDGPAEWTGTSTKRHHHAPTVEDVLTEFGIDWEHESDCEDRAALLKEYAAKLQLREDA